MASSIDLIYAEATDTGVARSENQDAVFAGQLKATLDTEPVYLFLVADGMGGYQGGDVASRIAAESFRLELNSCAESWPTADNSKEWLQLLEDLVRRINARILEAQLQLEYHSMGTTLTAAVECQGLLHLVHVGDSRLYHFDGENMYQITRDHSLVAELMRLGQLTPEEARVHPKRNVISQALGAALEVEIEAKSLELTPSSKLLFCSDGLSSMVPDEDILEILRQPDEPYDQVRALVDLANMRGGKDNISVIIACYRAATEEAGR